MSCYDRLLESWSNEIVHSWWWQNALLKGWWNLTNREGQCYLELSINNEINVNTCVDIFDLETGYEDSCLMVLVLSLNSFFYLSFLGLGCSGLAILTLNWQKQQLNHLNISFFWLDENINHFSLIIFHPFNLAPSPNSNPSMELDFVKDWTWSVWIVQSLPGISSTDLRFDLICHCLCPDVASVPGARFTGKGSNRRHFLKALCLSKSLAAEPLAPCHWLGWGLAAGCGWPQQSQANLSLPAYKLLAVSKASL